MATQVADIPRTQAVQSKTFKLPPLDGSLTLPEVYDWHLVNTPHHRIFVFCDDNNNMRTIYWPEAVKAVYNGVRFLQGSLTSEAELMKSAPVVAILAMADTITYFTMIMAVMRAGYTAFPISTRNSPAAVAHLVNAVGIRHILVGSDQCMADLAMEATQALKANYTKEVVVPQLVTLPQFQDLFRDTGDDFKILPHIRKEVDHIALYLHSSGSTAYPKPIGLTNRRVREFMIIPHFGERDLTNQVLSLHAMPMYHGMGFLQCCWTASCGLVISAFEPKSPAHVLTPDSLFQSAVATQSDIIFCVPSVIEAWSRNAEYTRWLATRSGVLFGGGPLNKTAGDYMTSQGVSIFNLYGATEIGVASVILPAKVGYDWDYFKFTDKLVTAEMVPYGDGKYELVIIGNNYYGTSVINTKVNGVDAYATSDLMTEHPTKPGYWRVYGRTDDQIMHSTGEKTNPGPLENILHQDPHVQSSVMFGRGKFQAGVLVDPKATFKFNPSDEEALESFRNRIWPTIQKMNKFAPQHSRLFKEMILVAKPDKPFQYTAKSTPRRQAIINHYEAEIEAAYAAVDATTQSGIPLPNAWDIISATNFVRAVIKAVLVRDVKDNDDIFQHGCDSLQATWIRNTLARALRDAFQLDIRKNTNNFVYDHPSILRLAVFILAHISGDHIDRVTDEGRQNDMEEMAAKYSVDFQAHTPQRHRLLSSGKVVLLTGSTGGLGTFVLAELVADEDVKRIYCINRPSGGSSSLINRQRDSLLDKALPVEILDSQKVVLLQARLDEPQFGLEQSVYDAMQHSVTHIIHNAWPVDFNLSLASFEPSIKGVRALIDFALSSPLDRPPTIAYTSTIGVFQNPDSATESLPESPIADKVAVGTGYSESKWVCEQILAAASARTALTTVIVRVGQICGGPNGFWSMKEWFPALVQSAKFISCLPTLEKHVSWLPVQVAARSLIDFMQSPDSGIVHLVHPTPIQWSTLGRVLSSEMGVPLVPYHEWLSKLEHLAVSQEEESSASATKAAALRLLNFYRNVGLKMDGKESSSEAFGMADLATPRAVSLSTTLAKSDQVGDKDAKAWLAYWRSVGFM